MNSIKQEVNIDISLRRRFWPSFQGLYVKGFLFTFVSSTVVCFLRDEFDKTLYPSLNVKISICHHHRIGIMSKVDL